MVRGFEILSLGLLLLFPLAFSAYAAPDSTPEICQPHDEKLEASALDAYFVMNLKEHERTVFSRPWAAKARARARNFLDQRIGDKRAEICADRLKLAEDIKSAPTRYVTSECASAAVITILDNYMSKSASAFDENRTLLGKLRDEHIRDIKLKLFEFAKGSTSGLEGSAVNGAPVATLAKEQKFEWIKQEASKLGGEAQLIWGGANPNKNPMIQLNLVLAREAARAKQERDQAKARYHSDGKLSHSCKLK